MVASAPGRIERATNLGDTSYGKYVVIAHGGNHRTLHAHLNVMYVVVGQRVDAGDPIGLVGETGNAYGAHLHYEQLVNWTDQHAVFNGVAFAYGSVIRSGNCPAVPMSGDWNGDNRTDVGIFKRAAEFGRFRERMPSGKVVHFPYALTSDSPITGDWNGNGVTDVGTWRQTGHTFFLRLASGATSTISFGRLRDRPVTGDWNGDGATDVGVWRPKTATFFLRFPGAAVTTYQLGRTRDLPVTGDWNGDGRTDVGVYEPATSTFTLRMPNGVEVNRVFGERGDLPVTGDWDGDGKTNIGVWRPSTATYALRYSAKHVERVRFGQSR